MEWSNDLSLKLIDEYKSFPILWNPKHPMHFSRSKKIDAWDTISNNLNISLFEVKQKMNSLLGSLRREKSRGRKNIGTGIGAEKVYVSKWFAFKRMEFLFNKHDPLGIDSVNTEQSDNSVDQIYSEEDDNSQVLDETINAESNENSQASTSEKRTSEQVIRLMPPKQKKRKSNNNENEARSEEAYCILKETVAASHDPTSTEDSCSVYAMHVANKLRTYNKRTRIEVENAINKILYAADIGEYDVYTINPPLSPDTGNLQYNAPEVIDVKIEKN